MPFSWSLNHQIPCAHTLQPGDVPHSAQVAPGKAPGIAPPPFLPYDQLMHIDPHDTDWWRRAVFYQIYPRSFQDSNADGIGDLPGITARLDYLAELGVDAIWISPTYPSPMKDFGYDVSDYCDVDPIFGSLSDMDRLIEEAHARNLRVVLDWVPNHSSDQHPWFIESRSSCDNPKRDWYYWRDAHPDGSVPNNWRAVFGGPAWEFEQSTGQYYLHSFLKEQPDLNWRNPKVVHAMYETLRFWMRRGIDGFRMDVIHMVLKHPEMPDNPLNPDWKPGGRDANRTIWKNNSNYPDVYGAVEGIRSVLDEFRGAMAVGETFGPPSELARFYGDEGKTGLHLTFNFNFIGENDTHHGEWHPVRFSEILARMEAALPPFAQPCYAFGNHDRSRFVSRNDDDGHGQLRARAAALLLLGIRGTPFIYYGDEIGMTDVAVPEGRLHDPARFLWEGRDPERTPMQWDESSGRGFSTADPWLPVGDAAINVRSQQNSPESLLCIYRRALAARRCEPALHSGAFREHQVDHSVYAFIREAEGARPVCVAINTTNAPRHIELPWQGCQVLVCTDHAREGTTVSGNTFSLPPLGAAWFVGPGAAADEVTANA